jgi:hypothetical protein
MPKFAISRDAPMSLPLLGLSSTAFCRFDVAVAQMPEKSGLPSASRGAGAAMFTVPSALRGTPAVA